MNFKCFMQSALRAKGLVLYRLGQTRRAVQFLEQSLTLYIEFE